MFADDTFSAKSDNDLNQLIASVNIEINKMAIWFRQISWLSTKIKQNILSLGPGGKNYMKIYLK